MARGVAQGITRAATGDDLRSEGVPERVPSDLAKASLLARAPKRKARVDCSEQLAAHVAEHGGSCR